jgi:replicative DNA helicase
MTLADDSRVSAGPREYDRTPPQAVEAEQSVLGAMMLSKDAIADVVEIVRPGDFYRPAHQLVYDAVLDLYARGEPADAVTVSAELTRAGQLVRAGGAPYLHTLISLVPTAANAGYYAQIVAERATLRRLVTAGTRIVQMGYDTASGSADVTGSVDDVVDRAQDEIYEVTARRTSEDYVHIESLLASTLDEIDKISATGGIGTGIPTGFHQLDEYTNGLHPGQMITVAGRPGSGKALALDTPLPTPTGWTTMGEVRVGDYLLGADGRPTRVVAATEVLAGRPCFDVEFCDGTVITADAEHQWLTRTATSRRVTVRRVTTAEVARTLRRGAGDRRFNHAVACTAPLELAEVALPVEPYLLGASLARTASGPAAATPAAVLPDGAGGTRERAGTALLTDVRIPPAYLRAGLAQRRALLAGLLNTCASVGAAGAVRFGSGSDRLVGDVTELLAGLGYRTERLAETSADGPAVEFTPVEDLFGSATAAGYRHRAVRPGPQSRYVVDARRVPSVPVRCVQVDNAEHLYLAGPTMVPTHNSTLALDFARSAAVKHKKPTVIFSLEMGKLEIMMRLFSAEAGVALQNMRSGHMSDQDWTRLARRSSELAEAPLFIDDSPNLTMMEIRAKARRLRQRQDLQLIVIDYLQLMTSGKRVESRQQEVSEFSRAMKLLAKELDVPVVALSQLNRGPEQRTDKKPMLSDLRESGSIEQDSDMVVLVHRPDLYEPETERAGEADLILAKHRNGPTATVAVAFQGRYSRFADMPN